MQNNIINTDKQHFLQRKNMENKGHQVSFRVTAPEKEMNSVNISGIHMCKQERLTAHLGYPSASCGF